MILAIFLTLNNNGNKFKTEEHVYLAQIDARTVMDKDEGLIKDLLKGNVNTIALQVYPDDNEVLSSSLSLNKEMLKDFINISHKNNLKIWFWMTTLDIPQIYEKNPQWRIKAYKKGKYTTETGWYKRVSPCAQEHRDYLYKFYYELASQYEIDGILLQDDLYLGENEDFSDSCKQLFRQEFGLDLNPSILETPLRHEFYEWRAAQLTEIVKGINATIKRAKPDIKLGVNIYPDSVIGNTDPSYKNYLSEIGQNYSQLSNNADYAVIMAYHRIDEQPVNWVGEVTNQAIKQINPDKVIIKVQGVDWNNGIKIPNIELKKALLSAKENGAENFGIYLWNFNMSDFDLVFP